ncbi:macro domain-containing protein [Cytobacillus firmus]|uniref:Appr-1-p processing domain-containing protein n=1 Tax=Cytobacillus firmus DS1 TaxID=1307436 RepID=W7L1H3_CYTFI|nr:macro domain-containing protein [Cytobacillus firmus]EWG08967.1 appr-1-p processing domain-containing protein [Cytobacillus firmus DS1]
MIEQLHGNLLDYKSDLLINAANGKGWMGGIFGRYVPLKGVADTIHYNDHSIEREAKIICRSRKICLGDIYITGSGRLGFKEGVLHAVTMLKPGQKADILTIEKCLNNICAFCVEKGIQSSTIPLLGTGTVFMAS